MKKLLNKITEEIATWYVILYAISLTIKEYFKNDNSG